MSDELVVFPIAIGNYLYHDSIDVDPEVARVVELFAEFGGREELWDIPMSDRGADAVTDRLRFWSDTFHGNTILYWVGHGWSNRLTASLAHARSSEAVGQTGVTPTALAHRIDDRECESDGWAIVIVDTCRSTRFVELLSAAVDDCQGPRRLLLIGSSGEGATVLGRFSTALHTVLRGTFRADPEIELWRLWPELKRNLPGGAVVLKNVEQATLRRSIVPVAAAATLDVIVEVEAVLAELTEDERRHFVPKAQGAELGELSWYFEGRRVESARIAAWLRNGGSGLLVVTGDAGSGKSALLGHLVVQSRPQLRQVLQRHGLTRDYPGEERPPDDAFDAVLHLTGLTPVEVTRRLAADLGVSDRLVEGDLRDCVDRLCSALDDQQCTILVDALDEAVTPLTVARSVLRPLAVKQRLIVGTRRSTLEDPDPDQSHPDDDLLNALSVADTTVIVERDGAAITRYVHRRLDTAVSRGLLPDDDAAITAAAVAIGDTGQPFLFARLVVHEILARPDLLAGSGFRDLVAGNHRRVFETAVARLSADRPIYGSLLQALAYSRGRGLPMREGVWSAVTTALSSGNEVADAGAGQLLNVAAPYVMLDREHGQSVYRLAHRTFAEYFTTEPDATGELRSEDRSRHHAIARRLITDADVDLAVDLNPYLTHYLSAHVGAAGEDAWLNLNDHPGVLDRLDPLAVGADAMRTAFGRFTLPPEIAGIVGALHLLAKAPPQDRPGLRQLAMVRHAGITRPETRDASTVASWSVRWASVVGQPTHLTLLGHVGETWAVCAVPRHGGRTLLATAGTDGTVRLWDPATGTPVGEPLKGHTRGVTAICPVLGPERRTLLVTGGDDGTVRLWDPGTGTPVGKPWTGHTGGVRAVCPVPGPQGRTLLATASRDAKVRLWDAVTGTSAGELLTGHTGPVEAVCAVPGSEDHTLLATSGDDGTVQLWDPATGCRVMQPLTGHIGPVGAVCPVPGPEGRTLLATGGNDRTVRVWDPSARRWFWRRKFVRLTGHTGAVVAVCTVPGPEGRTLLATGGTDTTVRLWDPTTGTPVGQPLRGHNGEVRAVCTVPGPGGRTLLATGGTDATVRVWDPTTGTLAGPSLARHTGGVWAVCTVPGPGGRTLLATGGTDDATVRMWEPATGAPVGQPLEGHTSGVTAVCAVPGQGGRTLLATGSSDATVRLWDPVTGTPVGQPLRGHTDRVWAVCMVPGVGRRNLLATVSDDATVRMWDPATGTQVGEPLTRHAGGIWAVCVVPGPNGRTLLATAGRDATVQVWDPATGTPVGEPMIGHTGGVRAVCAVPGPGRDTLLATAGEDVTVLLRDPSTGTIVGQPLTGHPRGVRAVCTVPGSGGHTLLATAGGDEMVRVWHPATGTAIGIFQLGVRINALCALHDGSLAIATSEGVVVLVIRLNNA
jgi:WD40 repeat protein